MADRPSLFEPCTRLVSTQISMETINVLFRITSPFSGIFRLPRHTFIGLSSNGQLDNHETSCHLEKSLLVNVRQENHVPCQQPLMGE
ncbi:hypothetical protein BS47DRAFT_303030 [Hydnum rufescens UP504]|uniref:Uncharacterized protein n=1 Tax=Hydnum rufescens UP504 TaxID=1448309 RepID=A0A9P6B681_9AGAM|nr:hypothetical protein BS47DRAFT_303030 [Hydnum rufescens UP504]